jgi:hypothetical protein
MVQRVVTVNDVLDGHVALDIECLDRIYLNAYVPLDHKWSKQLITNAGTTGTGHTFRRGRPPSPRC